MLLKVCITCTSQYINHWYDQSLNNIFLKPEWIAFEINYIDISNQENQLSDLNLLLVCNRTIILIILSTRGDIIKRLLKNIKWMVFTCIFQNPISLVNSILSTWPYHTKLIALVPLMYTHFFSCLYVIK